MMRQCQQLVDCVIAIGNAEIMQLVLCVSEANSGLAPYFQVTRKVMAFKHTTTNVKIIFCFAIVCTAIKITPRVGDLVRLTDWLFYLLSENVALLNSENRIIAFWFKNLKPCINCISLCNNNYHILSNDAETIVNTSDYSKIIRIILKFTTNL